MACKTYEMRFAMPNHQNSFALRYCTQLVMRRFSYTKHGQLVCRQVTIRVRKLNALCPCSVHMKKLACL